MSPEVVLLSSIKLKFSQVVGQALNTLVKYLKYNIDMDLSECVGGQEFVHHSDNRGTFAIGNSVKDFIDFIRMFYWY